MRALFLFNILDLVILPAILESKVLPLERTQVVNMTEVYININQQIRIANLF